MIYDQITGLCARGANPGQHTSGAWRAGIGPVTAPWRPGQTACFVLLSDAGQTHHSNGTVQGTTGVHVETCAEADREAAELTLMQHTNPYSNYINN